MTIETTYPHHTTIGRMLSPTLFAVIALAFFLPFATVSCDGATTHTTGIQLVTRTVPNGGKLDLYGDCEGSIGQCVEAKASNTATVAFVAALVGLVLGLLGIVRGPGWCGLVGFVAIFALPFEGLFADISLEAGWVIAWFGFLAAGIGHAVWALRRGRRRRREKKLVAALRMDARDARGGDYDGARWPRPRPVPHSSRT
jgi:hypothetical protein